MFEIIVVFGTISVDIDVLINCLPVLSLLVLTEGPKKTLSAPEHFEYALQHATGDYVLYLTDKMMLLPDTLEVASHVIKKTNAEIVNWTYVSYEAVDYLSPETNGVVKGEWPIFLETGYEEYDSIKHLAFKSSGALSRSKESIRDYVKGKICFGCYSKDLINRILEITGSVYGGVIDSTVSFSSKSPSDLPFSNIS